MTSRFVGRLVFVHCIALLGCVAGLSARASAEPTLLAQISVPVAFQACDTQPYEAVRPTLRYKDYGVEIGGVLPVTALAGDGLDFDSTSSPGFNNLATLISNGVDDGLGWRVDILGASGLAGSVARDKLESAMLPDSPSPDLVGARLDFVRFAVDGIDAGAVQLSCQSGTGNFLNLEARWQFWGTPRPELTVDSRGCDPCAAGQLAVFVATVTNPGLPLSAEIKLTVTLPDGAPVDLLGGFGERVLPSGPSEIPLVEFIVPGEVPNGIYVLEAALVDPARGITLARSSMSAMKQ